MSRFGIFPNLAYVARHPGGSLVLVLPLLARHEENKVRWPSNLFRREPGIAMIGM